MKHPYTTLLSSHNPRISRMFRAFLDFLQPDRRLWNDYVPHARRDEAILSIRRAEIILMAEMLDRCDAHRPERRTIVGEGMPVCPILESLEKGLKDEPLEALLA